jgi:hypothetical protein
MFVGSWLGSMNIVGEIGYGCGLDGWVDWWIGGLVD